MGELDLDTVRDFATALLIGMLLGVERERHKQADQDAAVGGLRTFMLFALLGALGAWLTVQLDFPWILVAVVLATLVAVVASYVLAARAQPDALGLTTELAAIAICLLGAMVMFGHREIAVALTIAIAAVLAYKQPLHSMVSQLDAEDIYAGVRLLAATFIVLPLLPDRTVDPWDALNPHKLWLLVLLISGISLVGYVAVRLLGQNRGIPLTGLTGGLVSSTAVTLSFARQSGERGVQARAAPAFACGILIAWSVMFLRVLAMVLIVNRSLLMQLAVPFLAMAAVAAGVAWLMYRRAADGGAKGAVPLQNPFSLTSAAKFAALFAAVLLVVAIVQQNFPPEGIYFVAALAGTTDVDAITLSMADYARRDAGVAARAIAIAALSNTVVKALMVVTLGAASLRRPVLIGAAAVVLAGIATLSIG
jgi:uncharacterized membrane protein (DUF4010 family)